MEGEGPCGVGYEVGCREWIMGGQEKMVGGGDGRIRSGEEMARDRALGAWRSKR